MAKPDIALKKGLHSIANGLKKFNLNAKNDNKPIDNCKEIRYLGDISKGSLTERYDQKETK